MTVVARLRLGEQVVVPARPRAPPAGQHPHVGVEHRLVGLIGDRAEDLVLAIAGVAQAARAPGRNGSPAPPRRTALPRPPRGLTSTWSCVARDGIDRRVATAAVRRTAASTLRRTERIPRGPSASGAGRETTSMPWLSKNSARKRAGKLHIWRGSADHTADA